MKIEPVITFDATKFAEIKTELIRRYEVPCGDNGQDVKAKRELASLVLQARASQVHSTFAWLVWRASV